MGWAMAIGQGERTQQIPHTCGPPPLQTIRLRKQIGDGLFATDEHLALAKQHSFIDVAVALKPTGEEVRILEK